MNLGARVREENSYNEVRLIVDAQIHLWDDTTPGDPEDADFIMRPHLSRPLTWRRYIHMMNEASVDRAFIMPPPWCGGRLNHSLEAATQHPDRFAVVPTIDFQAHTAKDIWKWAADRRIKAIRAIFTGSKSTYLNDNSVEWLWRSACEARLPIMTLAPGKLQAIGTVARRYPDLSLIIDHMGLTVQIVKSGLTREAIDAAVSLARHENVCIKLTSTATYSRDPYPFHDMSEFLVRLIGAFGAARCFWGTDLTMAFDKCSYSQRVTHFADELSNLSADELELVMGRALLSCTRWNA